MDLLLALIALLMILSILIFLVSMMYYAVLYVPFVPSSRDAIAVMLKAAELKPGQKVYDLGCGDGRLLIRAAKEYGVRAEGFEVSWFVYLLARVRNRISGAKAVIWRKNFFRVNLSDADVVFCYLFPGTMRKLRLKFEAELKPGTRVISNAFNIAGWKEEASFITRKDRPNNFLVKVYKVPEAST